MMRAAFVHERDANRTKIEGLVADVEIDIEQPSRSLEDFRKKFIDICGSVRLSAG